MRHMTFAAALIVALSIPMAAQTLDAQLQKAIQTETVTGDLKAAIAEYRRIAETAGRANRRIAAQALVRMAECHRKLGDAEAAKIYERVVRDFGDQPEAAAEARMRLAGMRAPAGRPASQTARQIWKGAGADATGAPSLDGRVLSYTDWDTGDLGLRDLVTGQNRRLTNTGGWEKSGDYAEASLPSPDGSLVAYSWFSSKPPDHRKKNYYDLRLVAAGNGDAAKARVLYEGEDTWVSPGAWTPDGQSLVFQRQREKEGGADLAIISVKTGAVRSIRVFGGRLFTQRVSVSPDGRYVAYDLPAAHPSSPRDIFVSAIDGTSHTVVAANPAADIMPLFASDGGLLFLSNRGGGQGLWAIAMRDGKAQGDPRLLKPDVGQFYPLGLTLAGALYYFSGGDHLNSYIQAVDDALAPAAAAVPVTNRFQNNNMSASWSPDGRSLAFYAFQGLRENQGASLVVRDTASGDDREFPLNVKPIRMGSPARWFADGKSVLVAGRNPDGEGNVFSRLDLAAGREVPLLKYSQMGPATWSAVIAADAKSIFHISADTQIGIRTLRRFDVDTGASTVLLEHVHAIALSPDGRHLAYVASTDANGKTVDIGIVPIAGGDRRILLTSSWLEAARTNALSWTPDNRHVLFVRPDGARVNGMRGSALWRVPAAGGEARHTGISARGQITHPALHPDGTRLVYTVRETSESSVWVLENFLPAPAARK